MLISVGRSLVVLGLALAVTVAPRDASAKLFSNSYVAFELPARWECELIDTEWVCRNTDTAGDKSKEAIVILTAKEVGPTDSFEAYEAHLKTPRSIPSSSGTPIVSTLIGGQVARPKYNDHIWIEAMHLNSEVRDYYTRYVATVKDRIAILVTLSAHKAHYSKYVADFSRVVRSLRVLNTRSLMNAQGGDPLAPGAGGQLGSNAFGGALIDDMGEDPMEGSGGSGMGFMTWILLAAVVLGAAGVYMLMSKDKGRKRR